ncbi:MAG: hypothetical protein P4N60_24530 [Verrucomicrobiae bacterium]|nr:hypothetical protein [Verrucomicrobiae bacterium]
MLKEAIKESFIGIVTDYLSYLQGELISEGYMIRGAITAGDICISGDIVFGPALIEAVEGEKKAVFPRIILLPRAVELYQIQWNMTDPIFDLCEDSDGLVFLDYLEATVMIAYPDDRAFTEFLDGSKQCISDNLGKYANNVHIRAKYEWAASYHNAFCKRYTDMFCPQYLIEVEKLVQPPKRWLIKK